MDQSTDSTVPLWRRLAAASYDALVVAALWFIAASAALALARSAITPDHPLAELLFRLYLLTIGFAFFGGFWVRKGQTLGMLAWRVKVVQSGNGALISWKQALVRYLLACAVWMALLCGVAAPFLSGTYLHWNPTLVYAGSGILVLLFLAAFRRAPARFGGITWYDKLSGTCLKGAASFAEISNR